MHEAEGIFELEPCGECHPTGVSGEAERLGYGLGGQTGELQGPGPNIDGQLPGGGAEIRPSAKRMPASQVQLENKSRRRPSRAALTATPSGSGTPRIGGN